MTRNAKPLLLILLLLAAIPLPTTAADVDELLTRKEAPAGVVFEVVTGSEDYLETGLPRIRRDIERLRARFPKLEFAVVTHGSEQFALLKDERHTFADSHKLTQSLVADDVPVHVCGTHASWRNMSEEDFPDYVDVSASGPAQVNDYLALGYELVLVK